MADWLPAEQWWHVTAPFTTGSHLRSAALLERVIDQFPLAHPRYQRNSAGFTQCNIFLNDITRALGCEVAQVEQGSRGPHELDANAQIQWLMSRGLLFHGWREVAQPIARQRADDGYPVAATWLNLGGIGHVAVGTPAPLGTPADGILWVAQAGASNFRRGHVTQGFGPRPLRIFTHD